jgi:pimeloyl-ACP methyl ester carboxylesterase
VPLLHIPDPWRGSPLIESLAVALAPAHRVLSLAPRPALAYQAWAADIVAVLDQFSFVDPVLAGEGAGCIASTLVAAWYPNRVGRLVLVDPRFEPPAGEDVGAWSLHDCPPDLDALRARLTCDVLEMRAEDSSFLQHIEALLTARLP